MAGNEYLNNKEFEALILGFQRAKRELARYELMVEDIVGVQSRVENFALPEPWGRVRQRYDDIVAEHALLQSGLGAAFRVLAENLVRYKKFRLLDIDDAIQEGAMICFEKIDRFDPAKGKAFNYMTTCILHHYYQLYRTIKGYDDFLKRLRDELREKDRLTRDRQARRSKAAKISSHDA